MTERRRATKNAYRRRPEQREKLRAYMAEYRARREKSEGRVVPSQPSSGSEVLTGSIDEVRALYEKASWLRSGSPERLALKRPGS